MHGNTAKSYGDQVFIKDNESDPIFLFCDIQGGKESFAGPGSGINYKGLYENNIDADPLFVNAALNDYNLTDVSKCIGAGIDSIQIGSKSYYCPINDFNRNTRPNPLGSLPDIGAYENPLGKPDFVQTKSHSFLFEEKQRNYNVFLPKNYNSESQFPLVFNLHGYTLNKVQQMNYSKMNEVADTAGFIVVYPNAVGTAWNCGINATIGHVNDVGFINAPIDTLIAHYSIDEKKIYSCGFSLGGFMSHRLACELSNRIAAIGDVAGTMANSLLNNFETMHPMPVIKIHGTNDEIVSYNGEKDWASVEKTVNHWINFNQCVSCDTISLSDIGSTFRWLRCATNKIQKYFRQCRGDSL